MFQNKTKITISVLSSIFVLSVLVLGVYYLKYRQGILGAQAGGVQLQLVSANSSVRKGDEFSVNVYLDTTGASVTGADIRLRYDSNVLVAESITPGIFLPGVLFPGAIYQPSGAARIVLICNPASPKKGNGILATIKFKALTTATATNISFGPATFVAVLNQTTNAAGAPPSLNIKILPVVTPTVKPSATPVASGTPVSKPTMIPSPTTTPVTSTSVVITNGGFSKTTNPWSIFVQGTGFTPTQKIRVIDSTGKQWGTDLTSYYATGIISAILPSNSPPSACNVGKTCVIGVYLVDSNGTLSNKFSLTLPAK